MNLMLNKPTTAQINSTMRTAFKIMYFPGFVPGELVCGGNYPDIIPDASTEELALTIEKRKRLQTEGV